MKQSVRRFPITIFISVIFVIIQIYINENSYSSEAIREIYNRISMVSGMAIPLSLCLGYINEVFFKEDKVKKILVYSSGLIVLILYYLIILNDINTLSVVKYIGTIIFLLLAIFYIPRLKNKNNYELHVLSVINSISITFIYTLVLYLGIVAILFTIDSLFDVNIDGKYYFYTFLIVTFIFGVSLFLSKLESVDENYQEYDYSSALKILLVYIVIPLITIYTLILYVYFAKILITWEWPRSLVSHLVLWYSTLSVFIIFLITPIIEENKIARYFKVWFPKLVLPILLMMFMSIYQRISQYGITENRYFVIVLGLWVSLIMIYFSLKKPLKNIIIPITLSLIILNSVYGPLSAFNVSIKSQNNRLNTLLTSSGFLINADLIKKSNVSKEEQREISNIIQYFQDRELLDRIKIFPDDFKTNDMNDLLGFQFRPDIYGGYINDNYFNYYLDQNQILIDIQGYDYYANLYTWSNNTSKIENVEIIYDGNDSTLKILIDETILFQDNIKTLVEETINNIKENPDTIKESLKLEDMILEKENEDIKIKIIFTNISGQYPNNNEEIKVDGTEFIILIDIK